ncbi:putative mitochondrial protein AtMg00820 [Nicotiana tabacum]|uniref:Mitochondrial protein AtMg00820 n=1 Tax=Nicotiana tabacum TaxID=4097 RepID=A0AC58THX1_TOBAC
MKQEVKALEDNRTWEVVDLPHGKRTVGSKWVYKTKYKVDGEVERIKARLVENGYSQQKGLDYHDTFSPAVKMVTVRSVIALQFPKDGTYIKWKFTVPFDKEISVKKFIWICRNVSKDRGNKSYASYSSPYMGLSKL